MTDEMLISSLRISLLLPSPGIPVLLMAGAAFRISFGSLSRFGRLITARRSPQIGGHHPGCIIPSGRDFYPGSGPGAMR